MNNEALKAISGMYLRKWFAKSDISEHMPILKRYGMGCEHITEMGVRDLNSTWAFLYAKPKKLVSIDWDVPPFEVCRRSLDEAQRLAKEIGIEHQFISADSTQIVLEETDLLFIDTWHNYEQLLLELSLHSSKVRKHIIAHDTNEQVFPGMFCAIEDFINSNPHWQVSERIDDFPGLTVLARRGFGEIVKEAVPLGLLREEINVQRELYYSEINENGSSNPAWEDYRQRQFKKFANADRWPLANKR